METKLAVYCGRINVRAAERSFLFLGLHFFLQLAGDVLSRDSEALHQEILQLRRQITLGNTKVSICYNTEMSLCLTILYNKTLRMYEIDKLRGILHII